MVGRRRFLTGLGAVALTGMAACSDEEDPATGPRRRTTPGTESGRPTPSGGTRTPEVASTIASGLNVPWSIVFEPSGDALVSERDNARVLRISAGGRVRPLGEVPDVAPSEDFGEGGLLGLALDPDDAGTLFAYHSTDSDNRVVRMRVSGNRIGRPTPVLTGIPVSTHHNGGRLAFGPDGMLYVSTGDAEESERAQDTNDLGGKILRIRRDGRPAPGNPFDNEVWTYGHRNIEGLAFDAADRLWATEFGDASYDELNLIERGQNYGWPEVEGKDGSDFTDPLQVWAPAECSPAAVAIADGVAYIGALRGERLISVPLAGRRTGEPAEWFDGEYGRLRGVAVAPDGALWVSTSNTDGRADPGPEDDRILRVTV
ncbi:PQQ-dependent sugar dehydrogenase [Solicola gregarius]|uniref:PQQ-dependent sugar dehydrogenase n=1 Tax=Solicola gregarius TaxID=2908642 RepID=A0AA46TFG2_9ACTN|nr:PQQ-dependent sugar dehydrogenase [Solicola gregarius]UYM04359.1 PQQ-dependent sugar dehydrogenase [Solicola gregarius]